MSIVAAGLVVLVLGVLALGAAGSGWRGTRAETTGRVLLADFTAQASDSSLAAVVTEALRIDLEQNLGRALLCGRETDAALQRMNREARTPIQGGLARELAVREGADYVLAGQVAGVGDGFILSGRVVRAADGAVVGSLREIAESEAEIIGAIERLSRGLVGLTGRSLRIAGGAQPLVRVTTSSLDALRLYTEAVRLSDAGADVGRALSLLDQAVALDSAFAMAHRKTAVLLGMSFAGRARRVEALESAFRYRERLPRSERGLVEGAYHQEVTGNHEAAVQAYEATLEIDPANITALANLASLYIDERRYAEADRLLGRCTAAPVPIAPCYYRRLHTTYALEGEEAARAAANEADAIFPTSLMIAFQRIWLEAAAGNYDRADSLVDGLRGRADRNARAEAVFLQAAADLDAVRGRFRQAREHLDAAVRLAEAAGLGDAYYRLQLAAAWYAIEAVGDTATAIARVDSLMNHPLVRRLDPLDYPYTELAELYARAGRAPPARALLRRFEQEVPRENQALAGGRLDKVRGLLALAEGRLDLAEALFAGAERRLETPLLILPAVARLHEIKGDMATALQAYRSYLETRDLGRLAYDAVYLGPILGRVATIEGELGHDSAAEDARRRLADLRVGADENVRAVVHTASGRVGSGAGT